MKTNEVVSGTAKNESTGGPDDWSTNKSPHHSRETTDYPQRSHSENRFIERFAIWMSSASLLIGLTEMVQNIRHVYWGNPWPYLLLQSVFFYLAILAALIVALRRNGVLNRDMCLAAAHHENALRELRDMAIARRTAVFRELHLTADMIREYTAFLVKAQSLNSEAAEFSDLSVKMLNSFCDKVAGLLHELHGKRIVFRVTIKGIGKKRQVFTLARDQSTAGIVDLAYERAPQPLDDNSDFIRFVDKKQTVWASDDLFNEWKHGGYRNSNKNFTRYYNATMVVPIRSLIECGGSETGQFELAGFLCVDCVRAPDDDLIFTERSHEPKQFIMNLLLAYADIAFMVIKRGRICGIQQNESACQVDAENIAFVEKLHQAFIRRRAKQVCRTPRGQPELL